MVIRLATHPSRARAFLATAVRGIIAFTLVSSLAGTIATPQARAVSNPPGRLKVLGLSLLLPGLGHRALGYNGRSAAFMSADGGIWTSFVTFRVQGSLRKDSYAELAKVGAGVARPEGGSDEFYRLLGSYPSSDAYDDEIRRDARAHFPNDLEARAAYFERHRIPEERRWEWASSAAWMRYQDKRSEALQSNKRAHYMLGLAVANRILAAVDGLRLVHRRGQEPKLGLFLRADPLDPNAPAYLGVNLRLP